MKEYPKLLVNKGKHGDISIIIIGPQTEDGAWLAMFRAMQKWNGFWPNYISGSDSEGLLSYGEALLGNATAARLFLYSRHGYEYETVDYEDIYTVTELNSVLDEQDELP